MKPRIYVAVSLHPARLTILTRWPERVAALSLIRQYLAHYAPNAVHPEDWS